MIFCIFFTKIIFNCFFTDCFQSFREIEKHITNHIILIMNELYTKNYIKDRLEPQIKWYSSNARANKTRYQALRLTEIVFSVSLPVQVSFLQRAEPVISITIAISALTVAFSSSVLLFFKFQDKWIRYRSTAELLKREKNLFLMKAGPYEIMSEGDFALRIEDIILQESTAWTATMLKEISRVNRGVDKNEE